MTTPTEAMPTPSATPEQPASRVLPGTQVAFKFSGFKADGLESGAFQIRVKTADLVEGPNPFKNNEIRTQIRLGFELVGQEERGVLYKYLTPSMHVKSNTPAVMKALKVPADKLPSAANPSIDVAALVGLTCTGLITVEPSTKQAGALHATIASVV